MQLIKAAPGASVPEHTHGGSEITLVLRGALIDSTGRYAPGDVADVDEHIEHTPVADAEAGCICAIANEQPTRFREQTAVRGHHGNTEARALFPGQRLRQWNRQRRR